MSLKSLLIDTCRIRRPTISQSDNMSAVASFGTSPLYPCRVRLLSEQEREVHGRTGTFATHRFVFDKGVTVYVKDELQHNSKFYRVITVDDVRKCRTIDHIEADAFITE